jgi:hypothetical protein
MMRAKLDVDLALVQESRKPSFHREARVETAALAPIADPEPILPD